MPVCENCGGERQVLHRHRLKPGVDGGRYEDGNIVMLCSNCHEDTHEGPFGGTLKGRLSNSPEALAKKSATMKEKWQDPAYREKVTEGQKRGWKDPARRRNHSKAAKTWYAENPEKVKVRNAKIAASRKGKKYPKLAEAQRARGARRRDDLSYIPISREELTDILRVAGSLRGAAKIVKDKYGFGSYGTIANWCDAYGIPRKGPGRPKKEE